MLCDTWDLPGSGIEFMFPALTGGFFTTEPPVKSPILFTQKISLNLFNALGIVTPILQMRKLRVRDTKERAPCCPASQWQSQAPDPSLSSITPRASSAAVPALIVFTAWFERRKNIRWRGGQGRVKPRSRLPLPLPGPWRLCGSGGDSPLSWRCSQSPVPCGHLHFQPLHGESGYLPPPSATRRDGAGSGSPPHGCPSPQALPHSESGLHAHPLPSCVRVL